MAERVQLGKRGSDYGLFVSSPTSNSEVDGTVSNSTSVTLDAANASIKVGQTVTGDDISGSVTVSAISGTSLTLSAAQTIADEELLTFHGVDVTTCADKDLSFVTAVQPSLSIFTPNFPALIIGSIVKVMPGFSSIPVFLVP